MSLDDYCLISIQSDGEELRKKITHNEIKSNVIAIVSQFYVLSNRSDLPAFLSVVELKEKSRDPTNADQADGGVFCQQRISVNERLFF